MKKNIEKKDVADKPSGGASSGQKLMTLQKAVNMGEYDPEYLSTFLEWHSLSRHMQFQYIREALDNRNKHLIRQWAEINNMLDFKEIKF